MKKVFITLLALGVINIQPVFGAESAAPKTDAPKVDMKLLQDNISNLRKQEIVVQVLAGQYNKELAELRKMEAVFCDVYQLDVNLWRAGKYEWNEEHSSFIPVMAAPETSVMANEVE